MNWFNYLWAMITGVCLTMAMVHMLSGVRGAQRAANLLFSLLSLLMGVYSVVEWRLMHAFAPAEYLEWLRWLDILGAGVAIALAVFIWVYLGAGRRWLAMLSIGAMALSIIPDLGPTPKLVFLEITAIKAIPAIGGGVFASAEGINNPWNPVYYGGIFLLMVFVVDISVIHWRRGESGRAAVVGATVVLIYLSAGTQAYLVDEGILQMPYMVSAAWLFLLAAMASELSGDQLRAVRLAAELSENQKRMHMATSAVDLGAWDWDVEQDRIEATAPSQRHLGLDGSERMDFNRALHSIHPDDRDSFEQTVRYAIDRGAELETEYRVITLDGAIRWIAVRASVERDQHGKARHLRGVSIDITRGKLAESEAEQLRRDLSHISRTNTLNELSGSLAHELNQPLGIILSNAEAAQALIAGNLQIPGEVGEILSDIVAADRRAAEVIQRMRAMLERGDLSFSPLALNDVLEDVLTIVRADLLSRRVTVVTDLAQDLPLVTGDRIQIQQVALNLVLNAADAMAGNAPGTRHLFITTTNDDGRVRVSVRDEGAGLPTDVEQVFRPFFTTKKGGLGMGLAICKSIIAAHDGRLWGEPHPERGAVFCFELAAASDMENS